MVEGFPNFFWWLWRLDLYTYNTSCASINNSSISIKCSTKGFWKAQWPQWPHWTWWLQWPQQPLWPQKNKKTACTLHTEWYPWHQDPQQPQWPQWPQQPQWPQWPQQSHFIKKFTELDVFIHLSTKMIYPDFSMWDGSSKIHYFIDFWPSFTTEAVTFN